MSGVYEELRVAAHGIWQRRWLALGIAWLVCLAGWLVVALVPNSYESKARIYVQLDNVIAEQIGIGQNDHQRDLDRVRDTLTSAANLEAVVKATRLAETVRSDKDMENAVAALAKSVKVVNPSDNLFEIDADAGYRRFTDRENARLAQDIATRLIDIFRRQNLEGPGDMSGTLAFMDRQLGDRQKELEAAEARREQFESKNAEMLPGVGGGLGGRLASSRDELRGIEADLVAAQSGLAALNGQLSSTPQTIAVPGAAGGARGALAQAQAELAGMRARGLTDEHPDVIAAKGQIAALQRQIAADPSRGMAAGTPNPAFTTLISMKTDREATVASLVARKAALQQSIADLDAKQYAQPELAAQSAKINRDYDVLKEQYDKLLKDREALRLRGQIDGNRGAIKFNVIDPPSTPRSPAAPNRPLLLLLVLVVGLGAGGGAAFLIGQMRTSFATVSQLERATGFPVLGAVTETVTRAARATRMRHLRYFAGGTAGLFAVLALLLAVEFLKRGMVA